ncbi:hypothetical protein F4680DRAFT_445012 [Xylaria scruposa]|nr:hypothetical protein F4680DRAFT_445012 [Xylaria scruposa]
MHFLSMFLLGLLPGATPLALNRVTNPDAVDFSSVGDVYKRNLQSSDNIDFDQVGDVYKRSIQSPDEVEFDQVGDVY